MSNIWNKFKDVLSGVDLYDEDDYEEYEEEIEAPRPVSRQPEPMQNREISRTRGTTTSNSNGDWRVVNSSISTPPTTFSHRKTQIKLAFPKTIEDSRAAVSNIKSEIVTIIDLHGMDVSEAQRIADFLAGAVDALEGQILRLNNDMFLVAPQSVDVHDSKIKEDLRSNGVSFSSVGFGGL